MVLDVPLTQHHDGDAQASHDARHDVVVHDSAGQVNWIAGLLAEIFEEVNRPGLLGVEDPKQDERGDERPDAGVVGPRPDDQRREEHPGHLVEVGLVEVAVDAFTGVPLPRTPPTQHERFAGANRPQHATEVDEQAQEGQLAQIPPGIPPHQPQEDERQKRPHQPTPLTLEARMDESGNETGEEGRREEEAEPATPAFIATNIGHGPSWRAKLKRHQNQTI